MNRVFARIKKDADGVVGDKQSFSAVVCDNYVEDIEFSFLADPGFLGQSSHLIVATLVEKNDAVADVIEAALTNETNIYVNSGPEMDRDAYRGLVAGRSSVSP